MGLNEWMNSKLQNMRWFDISLVKLSSAAFALLIAKLWAPLLALQWYWYLLIGILAAIRPMYKIFKKEAVAENV